jgi:hypothetical protein
VSDSANPPPPTGTPPRTPTDPPSPDYRAHQDDAAFKQWLEADPANIQHTRALRGEAATYRKRARAAEQQLAALDTDGSGRVSLAVHQQEIRTLRIENGLLDVSHRLGVGNVKLLKAYMADSLTDIDPSEPTFLDDLTAKIEEALEAEPALKSGRPGITSGIAPRTGAQFTPAPPSVQLSRADVNRMTPEEIVAAKDKGLLDSILGRK